MIDETQLQRLADSLQGLSDRLAEGGQFLDAAIVSGGLQAIRALWTRLQKLETPERQPLAVVPPEPEAKAEGG